MKTKRKFLSLLLVLYMVLTLVPMTAFAEEQSMTLTITTVQEFVDFAKAVNDGEYDEKTDAVVDLKADLDMTGVEWTPIGLADSSGNIEHCFMGTFYGNGHRVYNLSFSETYGDGLLAGLFGYIEKATVRDLTVEGSVSLPEDYQPYTFFGAIAAYAVEAKIIGCVSNVEFVNNGKSLNGSTIGGVCGYAADTYLGNCETRGDFQITDKVNFVDMGGVVGCCEQGVVENCAMTGDISTTAKVGGIAGPVFSGAQILNCFMTGAIASTNGPIDGTPVGGIVCTAASNAVIKHCYFSSSFDLSAYQGADGYLGGLAGTADTSVELENNFFAAQTAERPVPAVGNRTVEGAEKDAAYMQTEEFYEEINAGGGNYRYVSGQTPQLPQILVEVSFAVTPADAVLTVSDASGDTYEVADGKATLPFGSYTVKAVRENYATAETEFIVTADHATHICTLTLEVLPADYTDVDKAITKANALKKDEYKDFSAVEAAISAVVRDKNITEQAAVDAMAKAIEDAIADLEYKDADYSKVDEAIAKANALKKDEYEDFSAVEAAINAVVRDKNITEQAEVDAMAKAVEDAVNSLEKITSSDSTDPSDPTSPETGDNSNLVLWLALLFVAGGAVLTLTIKRNKVKN